MRHGAKLTSISAGGGPGGPARRRRVESPGRALVLAFAFAVSAFGASSTLIAVRLRRVTIRSHEISAMAMPRVLALARLREELHRVEDDLDASVDGQAIDSKDLGERLASLQAQVASYVGPRDDAHGPSSWGQAFASIESTLAAAHRVRGSLDAGDLARARSTMDALVRPAASSADTDLWHLVQASASEGVQAAQSIESIRDSTTGLSVALDACCAGISAWLALLAFRAMKRHTDFIEARSTELEQFAFRVAHDLRGPLQPVTLALQFGRERLRGQDTACWMLDRGVRSVERLNTLIGDLLAFACSGGLPEEDGRSNLREGVALVVDDAAADARAARIELEVDADLDATVGCGSGVLASLLSNLVRNAIKYMSDSPIRRVTVRTSRRGDRLRVEVQDTGPGLPPGAASYVFEPYVRADRTGQPGLGLGLATVKRLAEAHGGAAGVHAGADGCLFWFELPEAPHLMTAGAASERRRLGEVPSGAARQELFGSSTSRRASIR